MAAITITNDTYLFSALNKLQNEVQSNQYKIVKKYKIGSYNVNITQDTQEGLESIFTIQINGGTNRFVGGFAKLASELTELLPDKSYGNKPATAAVATLLPEVQARVVSSPPGYESAGYESAVLSEVVASGRGGRQVSPNVAPIVPKGAQVLNALVGKSARSNLKHLRDTHAIDPKTYIKIRDYLDKWHIDCYGAFGHYNRYFGDKTCDRQQKASIILEYMRNDPIFKNKEFEEWLKQNPQFQNLVLHEHNTLSQHADANRRFAGWEERVGGRLTYKRGRKHNKAKAKAKATRQSANKKGRRTLTKKRSQR